MKIAWYWLILLASPFANAQVGPNLDLDDKLKGGSVPSVDTVYDLTGALTKTALVYVGVGALAVAVYAGFLWMTAAGNSDQVKQAQTTLKWAAVGLLVIFGAYLILSLVVNLLQPITIQS